MIPTDYDVLVSFAPVANIDGSERTSINGGVSLRVELVDKVKLSDRTLDMAMYGQFVNVLRPGEIDIYPEVIRPKNDAKIIQNNLYGVYNEIP